MNVPAPRPISFLPFRLRAAAGIVGPVAFTSAWVFCTIREEGRDGYTVTREQVSGLAAPDARHPSVMISGFVLNAACTWMFASAVEEALGGAERAGWAPRFMRVTAAAMFGAGVLRRDQKLLIALSDGETQSTQNTLHDVMSGIAFGSMFFTPFALDRTRRGDPGPERDVSAGFFAMLTSVGLMAVLQSKVLVAYNGIIQRIGLALPSARMVRQATQLLRNPPSPVGASSSMRTQLP